MNNSADDEAVGGGAATEEEPRDSDQVSDSVDSDADAADPPQMDLSELKERLQSVKPRTWGVLIVVVVIVVLIATRCGGARRAAIS